MIAFSQWNVDNFEQLNIETGEPLGHNNTAYCVAHGK